VRRLKIQEALTNRAMLVCKVAEVWQDFLSEYVDKKFAYIKKVKESIVLREIHLRTTVLQTVN